MKTKNISGFTLIETLVALSIFSVVVLAIYSTFSVGITARNRGEEISDLYQKARIILDRMAIEMRNTVKYSSCKFIGTSESVSFPTLLKKGDHSEICHVAYYLETNEEDHTKVLKRREETPVGGTDDTTDISPSVAEMNFNYGYRLANERSYQWSDSWDSSMEETYPQAIKIRLTLGQDDRQKEFFIKTVHIPISGAFDEGQL